MLHVRFTSRTYSGHSKFFPHHIPFPEVTTDTLLRQASQDIVSILQNPPKPLPYLDAGDETQNALLKIATLLQRATKPPQANTLPAPTPGISTPAPVIPASLPRVHLPRLITTPPSSHRMVLRGRNAPPRVQHILPKAAPPRVQVVTPQQVPLTPDRRLPVQVTQHISVNNSPVLSTYHSTMKNSEESREETGLGDKKDHLLRISPTKLFNTESLFQK